MTTLDLRKEWIVEQAPDPFGLYAALEKRRQLREAGWVRRRK